MSAIAKARTKRKVKTARAVKETTATDAARNGAGRKRGTGKPKTVTYVGTHLVIDPDICHGQLTFKGTRVPVQTILDLMGEGHSMNFLARNYPEVSRTAMREALQMAARAMSAHYGADIQRLA